MGWLTCFLVELVVPVISVIVPGTGPSLGPSDNLLDIDPEL